MADMTTEVRQWLEAKFTALETQIESVVNKVLDITDPMKKDIEHLRGDIHALFDKTRELEKDVAIIKSDKEDKQINTGTIVAVIGFVLMLIVAGIGWIV